MEGQLLRDVGIINRELAEVQPVNNSVSYSTVLCQQTGPPKAG